MNPSKFLILAVTVLALSGCDSFEKGDAFFKKNDYASTLRVWEPLAKKGNAEAQDGLGRLYIEGLGVPKNMEQAAHWFEKAADQGLPRAQNTFGWMHVHGQGVKKDLDRGVLLVTKAAMAGHHGAEDNLGWLYANGVGVKKDTKQAMIWYQKAANSGLANAQYNLGWMYENGEDVPKDLSQAAFWIRKAADQGLASAQNYLGALYLNGEGVARDDALAEMWLNKAIAQGATETRQMAEENLAALQQRREVERKNSERIKEEADLVVAAAKEWHIFDSGGSSCSPAIDYFGYKLPTNAKLMSLKLPRGVRTDVSEDEQIVKLIDERNGQAMILTAGKSKCETLIGVQARLERLAQ